MGYQLDFTAKVHGWRKVGRIAGRIALLALLAGACQGARWTYVAYMSPTLGERLAEYHLHAVSIEEISDLWTKTADEYKALFPYYRLAWCENVTNSLPRLVEWNRTAPEGMVPVKWSLASGGSCELKYDLALADAGKTRHLEDARAWLRGVTGIVEAAGVALTDTAKGDLAGISSVSFTLKFALPERCRRVPELAPELVADRAMIADLKKRLRECTVDRSTKQTLHMLLQQEMAANPDPREGMNPHWAQEVQKCISPELFWKARDAAVPADEKTRQMRGRWTRIASARLPWRRERDLDNPKLAADIATLSENAADLPSKEALNAQLAKFEELRYPLAKGFKYDDVFNENFAALRVKEILSPFTASVAFKHAEGVVKVGGKGAEGDAVKAVEVLFPDWEASFSVEGGGVADVLKVVKALPEAGAGIAIGRAEVAFESGSPSQVRLFGKLPVWK